jgi:hypothetical protein
MRNEKMIRREIFCHFFVVSLKKERGKLDVLRSSKSSTQMEKFRICRSKFREQLFELPKLQV